MGGERSVVGAFSHSPYVIEVTGVTAPVLAKLKSGSPGHHHFSYYSFMRAGDGGVTRPGNNCSLVTDLPSIISYLPLTHVAPNTPEGVY